MTEIEIRHARPSDYGRVYPLVNEWWGGREMTQNLPSVFFVHFEGSSFIAHTPDCSLAGFLCGFLSETNPDEAYIHMAGVAPELRRQGIGRRLYDTFFETARARGRARVSLITAPINTGSIAFHEALGFELERVLENFAGPGEDRLVFIKRLT
ncbi:MAG TPA: N-acetyltransferase [Gaiellaceae bacterium]|jgi:ribosomal protein S18 acetylase RimI-like enzyme